MSDLINRQDAIDKQKVLDEIVRFSVEEGAGVTCSKLYANIHNMPSAEQKGQWIEEHEPFTWMGYTRWGCPCCGFKCGYELEIKCRTNFCPRCGADLRGREK